MKKLLFVIFPGLLIAVLYFWVQSCLHSPVGNLFADTSFMLLAFGRLFGVLAAAAILFQFLLISRVKWFEPLFGLDRLTRFHHILGLAIPVVLILHPLLLILHHAGQTGTGFFAQAVAILKWEDILPASLAIVLIMFSIAASLPLFRRRLSYEAWHWSHLPLYAGFALALGHQFELGGDINSNPQFALLWKLLLGFSLLNLFWGRFARIAFLYARHRFTVEKIVPETSEVESVWISGRNLDTFKAQAGQFAILRFWSSGFKTQAHPFSLSMVPDGNYLRFSIKRLGDFTTSVHTTLKPGCPVLVDGMHGVFTGHRCLGDKALFIAGGIGITPLRALAEEFTKLGRNCVLLYANREQKDIVFRRELAELEQSGCLRVHHILSSDSDWQGEKGRLDAGLIRRLVPDFAERDAFLCGPPGMMQAVKEALTFLGVSKTRIHFEEFSL